MSSSSQFNLLWLALTSCSVWEKTSLCQHKERKNVQCLLPSHTHTSSQSRSCSPEGRRGVCGCGSAGYLSRLVTANVSLWTDVWAESFGEVHWMKEFPPLNLFTHTLCCLGLSQLFRYHDLLLHLLISLLTRWLGRGNKCTSVRKL